MRDELIDSTKNDKDVKKQNRKRERELSDIRSILLKPEGRRFYWRIMEAGRMFQDASAGENTNQTFHNLGRQSVSRDFLNDLMESKPEALAQMQQERTSEEASEHRQEQEDLKKSGGLI